MSNTWFRMETHLAMSSQPRFSRKRVSHIRRGWELKPLLLASNRDSIILTRSGYCSAKEIRPEPGSLLSRRDFCCCFLYAVNGGLPASQSLANFVMLAGVSTRWRFRLFFSHLTPSLPDDINSTEVIDVNITLSMWLQSGRKFEGWRQQSIQGSYHGFFDHLIPTRPLNFGYQGVPVNGVTTLNQVSSFLLHIQE